MALLRSDKEKQLRELTSIVTGIRLFNRDCGKGGDGIDDPALRSVFPPPSLGTFMALLRCDKEKQL